MRKDSKRITLIKKSGAKSGVWRDYDIIYVDGKQTCWNKCCGKECKVILEFGLMRHLKTHTLNMNQKSLDYLTKKPTQVSIDKINMELVKLLTKKIRPFKLVESYGFLKFCDSLINFGHTFGPIKASTVLNDRKTLKKKLHNYHVESSRR